MNREAQRTPDQLRPFSFLPDFTLHAEGSVLVTTGQTQVLCNATVEERLPDFLQGKGQGWVTAEYAMLPRATHSRNQRERGNLGGRTQEIQRLIGRSLRSAVDLKAMGEICIRLDCDVLQADGGTRTASITGAFVALAMALGRRQKAGLLAKSPLVDQVAAVSLGLVEGEILLDLDYQEDRRAEVDLNLVMTGQGQLVEVQGTAEGKPFAIEQLQAMLALGKAGLEQHFAAQRQCLESLGLAQVLGA